MELKLSNPSEMLLTGVNYPDKFHSQIYNSDLVLFEMGNSRHVHFNHLFQAPSSGICGKCKNV